MVRRNFLAAILAAADDGNIVRRVFGRDVRIPPHQARIISALYKSPDGIDANGLKVALGYSADAATHATTTAIYQLRRKYGRDFIINSDGVYRLGHV